jgi:hypothetical protein
VTLSTYNMKQLHWNKCTSVNGDGWCGFNTLNLAHNLAHPHLDDVRGVYIVWHGGPQPRVVRVGQGDIRERLTFQRANADVQAYSQNGLFVTWASVPVAEYDGVERYLSDLMKPLTGDRWPDVLPIPVNSPFQ